MGVKDAAAKQFLADNRRFADVCNYFLYQGEEIIRPESLQEQDGEELLYLSGKDQKEIFLQRWRDILKSAVIKSSSDCIYLIIGLENQSEIHYAMPVRNMLYDTIRYCNQVDEAGKRHRREKDWKNSAEFLSGFGKEDRLLPVVTITIYWGSGKWDGPRSLHDMMQIASNNNGHVTASVQPDILKYVADYKLNLIVPSEVENFDHFHTSVREVLEVIRYAENEEAMGKLIHTNSAYQNLENEAVDIINVFAGLNLSINEEKGETDMCKAWDDHRKAGVIEGRKEGITELLISLYRSGDISASVAAREMHITPEEFKEHLLEMQ